MADGTYGGCENTIANPDIFLSSGSKKCRSAQNSLFVLIRIDIRVSGEEKQDERGKMKREREVYRDVIHRFLYDD